LFGRFEEDEGMHRRIGLGLVLVGLSVAACSGSSSGGVGAAGGLDRSQFTSPTGTFAPSKGASVLKAVGDQRGASDYGVDPSAVAGGGGTTSTSSAAVGLHTMSALSSCNLASEQGACTCPSGGSLTWSYQGIEAARAAAQTHQPFSIGVNARFASCAMGTVTVTGTEDVDVAVRDASSSQAAVSSMSIVAQMNLRVSVGGTSHDVSASLLLESGQIWFSIKVDDGNIVAAYQHGQLVIRDRNTTWTCSPTANGGRCISQTGVGEFDAQSSDWDGASGVISDDANPAQASQEPPAPTKK
jgi:hypothetical protein